MEYAKAMFVNIPRVDQESGEIEFPDGMEPVVFMNDQGQEVPNPNPIVIHLAGTTVNDYDRVREIIRRELSMQMAEEGLETEEEANDFHVDDDMFPVGQAEYDEDTEAADKEAMELEARLEEERDRKRKKVKKPRQAAPDEAPEGSGEVADPPGSDQADPA